MKKYISIGFAVFMVSCAPAVGTSSPIAGTESETLSAVLMDKNDGCMTGPTAQFGRYVGDWDIQDWTLSRDDGKTWIDGNGARWNFTCVGDGIGVQDFWMPNGGGVGTNLRIYNAETESWDIVWTATNAPGTMNINAVQQQDGEIVMSILSPEQKPPRRIIFYPPTNEGWDWAMQMDPSNSGSWTTVYKIKATRR